MTEIENLAWSCSTLSYDLRQIFTERFWCTYKLSDIATSFAAYGMAAKKEYYNICTRNVDLHEDSYPTLCRSGGSNLHYLQLKYTLNFVTIIFNTLTNSLCIFDIQHIKISTNFFKNSFQIFCLFKLLLGFWPSQTPHLSLDNANQ